MSQCRCDRTPSVVAAVNDSEVTSCYELQLKPCRFNDAFALSESSRFGLRRACKKLPLITLVVSLVVILDNCQLTTMAAPQSCVLCDRNDLKADTKDPNASYEEFLFEHQVTRHDAINALRQLNESFYEESSGSSSCKAVSCTKTVMKYCLGPQFINDHCWCELGHAHEGLPFIPHICYVGEKQYSASVGSCFFYEEVKECCCAPALAKQWRHISAAGPSTGTGSLSSIVISILLIVASSAFQSTREYNFYLL